MQPALRAYGWHSWIRLLFPRLHTAQPANEHQLQLEAGQNHRSINLPTAARPSALSCRRRRTASLAGELSHRSHPPCCTDSRRRCRERAVNAPGAASGRRLLICYSVGSRRLQCESTHKPQRQTRAGLACAARYDCLFECLVRPIRAQRVRLAPQATHISICHHRR